MNPTLNPNTGKSEAEGGSNGEHADFIHPALPPVTRVSRRAVMLVGVFGASLGLVILVLGFGQRAGAPKDAAAQENAIRPSGPIDSIKGLPRDYSFDVGQASYATAQTGPATRPAGLSQQEQALAEELRRLAEMRRKMLEQQQKEQQQALDSPLVFAGAKPTAHSSAASPATMPAAPVAGALASALRAGAGDPLQMFGPPAPASLGTVPQNHQRD